MYHAPLRYVLPFAGLADGLDYFVNAHADDLPFLFVVDLGVELGLSSKTKTLDLGVEPGRLLTSFSPASTARRYLRLLRW